MLNTSKFADVDGKSVYVRVLHVYDGDTAWLAFCVRGARGLRTVKVRARLANYNSPELHQPGGLEAKQVLEYLLAHQTVIAVFGKLDKYGRLLAHLFTETSMHVNTEMVRRNAGVAFMVKPVPAFPTAPMFYIEM